MGQLGLLSHVSGVVLLLDSVEQFPMWTGTLPTLQFSQRLNKAQKTDSMMGSVMLLVDYGQVSYLELLILISVYVCERLCVCGVHVITCVCMLFFMW